MHAFRAFSSLHSGSASFCGAVFLVCIAYGGAPASPSSGTSGLWGKVDISGAPVDPQSSAHIDLISRSRTAHPDFGPLCGIPYVGVDGNQPRVPVTVTAFGTESDSGFGSEAGLAILPGLVRLDEAMPGPIRHDFEVIQLGWR